MIEYRVLTETELPLTHSIFAAHGVDPPHPQLSVIVGAFEDGVLIGFQALQLVLHAEPLWVADGHSKQAIYPKLLQTLHDLLANAPGTDYYVFTERERFGDIPARYGFVKTPYEVWRRRVE